MKTNGKLLRINFEDVLFIEALSTYVVLITDKYKHVVGGTLKSTEERLPFRHFVRVHRSYIVNLHRGGFPSHLPPNARRAYTSTYTFRRLGE